MNISRKGPYADNESIALTDSVLRIGKAFFLFSFVEQAALGVGSALLDFFFRFRAPFNFLSCFFVKSQFCFFFNVGNGFFPSSSRS